MFTKTSYRVLALALFCIALAIAAVILYPTKPNPPPNLFEQKLDVRLELRDGEDGRIVSYYDDGLTRKHGIANHTDGRQSQYWYREDGTLKEAITFGQETDSGRTILRRATIDIDGKTFLTDDEFAADGKPLRTLKLVDANTSVEETFFQEERGKLKARTTITRDNEEKTWTLLSQMVYRLDGSKQEETSVADEISTTKLYNEQEVLVQVKVQERWKYKETDYRLDGTVEREVVQDSSSTEIFFRRPDGSLEEMWALYGPVDATGLHIYYYDTAEQQVFHQWWSYLNSTHVLNSISVYDKETGSSVRRKIYLEIFDKEDSKAGDITGETIYHSENGKKGPHTVRIFHPGGALKVETLYAGGSEVTSKVEHSAEENIRPDDLEARWLTRRKPKEFPNVIEYIPDDD